MFALNKGFYRTAVRIALTGQSTIIFTSLRDDAVTSRGIIHSDNRAAMADEAVRAYGALLWFHPGHIRAGNCMTSLAGRTIVVRELKICR